MMEDPLTFKFGTQDEVDHDALKNSGSEEEDVGYHSIGRNIKVLALLIVSKTFFSCHLQHGFNLVPKFLILFCQRVSHQIVR